MLLLTLAAFAADPEAQATSCLEGRDPAACRDGGLAFAYGEGVERDDARARTLFAAGCELADPQSCFHKKLLSLPEGALDVEANEEGIATLKARCSSGRASACYRLGVFHDRGPMGYRDMSQAMMLFRQACDDGEHGACFEQAADYASGGTDMGREKAEALFEGSCTAGHAPSCRELGTLLRPSNPDRATELTRRACELGDKSSCP